jgi:DNA adenine methylase
LLARFCPERIQRYYEPFLGSAALFLHLCQTRPRFKAILSDSNEELINVYRCVRDKVRDLIQVLLIHQDNYYRSPEEYFYYIRDGLAVSNELEKAARFIFLNRTCYNGLYRVNKSGLFNVPHGTYLHPTICQEERLVSVSQILNQSDAEILCEHYQQVSAQCSAGDLVYFDPPYLPVSKTANFKDYTAKTFGRMEQIELAIEFKRLSEIGCNVILSNSNSPLITDLYSHFNIFTVSTPRPISCNALKRSNHQELLISNKAILMSKSSQRHA